MTAKGAQEKRRAREWWWCRKCGEHWEVWELGDTGPTQHVARLSMIGKPCIVSQMDRVREVLPRKAAKRRKKGAK